MNMISGTLIVILLIINTSYSHAGKIQNTLQQLHVVFRHGDRNPERTTLYPKDPNINDTWAPDGLGQLTLNGKIIEYKLGQALRQRYNQFLGNIYTNDLIDPISTDLNRTKMSLELVLAGLFPPAPSQVWNNALPWQPIPYNYVSFHTNPIMKLSLYFCPKYREIYDQVESTEYFQKYLRENADLIEYINENSGLNANSYATLFGLRDCLYTELSTGRTVPKWTQKVYPEFLNAAGNLYYELQVYNDELNKYAGGPLLKKIISDMQSKQNGTLTPKTRKIFLYSGHEFNVAYILGALGVFKPHMPPYGSYVVVELHKINDIYGVKILHQDYSKSGPYYVAIPGCNLFCPLDQFIVLRAAVIPSEADTC